MHQVLIFSKDNPFTMESKPSEVLEYFNRIRDQYGSLNSFCERNNLSKAFFHRMYRASVGKVTPSIIVTLNESLNYYHKDVRLTIELKELSLEIFKLIKSRYSSVLQFCEKNNMMGDYQKIVAFCSGRRKKLGRELILKIRKIINKEIKN